VETVAAYVVTLLWFGAVLSAAWYADRAWSRMLGRAYWVFLAPGVAIHELSHVLACLITGAKITKVRLWGPEGGEVQHQPPKLPVIGQPIICLSPMVGCAATLALLGVLLDAPLYRSISAMPATLTFSPHGIAGFIESGLDALWAVARGMVRSDWAQWKTYVFLYAAVCLGISLRPSAKDLKGALLGLMAVVAVLALADLAVRAMGSKVVTDYLLAAIQRPMPFLVGFLGLAIVVTMLVRLVARIVRRLAEDKTPRDPQSARER
jgi:hypothetical protein